MGARIHGVDQCGEGAAALSGPLSASVASGFGILRSASAGSSRRTGTTGASSGVEGFCYWHYWFGHGRRVLERPLNEVLESGEPDFPFCLAWANHSWTGKWYGKPDVVWIEQKYPGPTDEKVHFDWALRAFRDRRYMTVDGKPIFCVLSPHLLPSPASFIAHWRQLAREAGLPGMYFVAISHVFERGVEAYRDPVFDRFDAVTRHVPLDYVGPRRQWKRLDFAYRWKTRDFATRYSGWAASTSAHCALNTPMSSTSSLKDIPAGSRFLPRILPSWDDTPRYGQHGVVYDNSTPELFARHLAKAAAIVSNRPQQEAIIFLKAWNEWAEGNYLEPDANTGTPISMQCVVYWVYADVCSPGCAAPPA